MVESRLVKSLGVGELFQSSNSPCDYLATLALNSYESNCTRDWLAHRWTSQSLLYSCVYRPAESRLLVSLQMQSDNLNKAKEQFALWLDAVLKDREFEPHAHAKR